MVSSGLFQAFSFSSLSFCSLSVLADAALTLLSFVGSIVRLIVHYWSASMACTSHYGGDHCSMRHHTHLFFSSLGVWCLMCSRSPLCLSISSLFWQALLLRCYSVGSIVQLLGFIRSASMVCTSHISGDYCSMRCRTQPSFFVYGALWVVLSLLVLCLSWQTLLLRC